MARFAEEVPPALAGQRIDRVVAMLTGVSRSAATALVSAGGVEVDGRVASRGADRLEAGSLVVIDAPEVSVAPGPEPEAEVTVPVVFVDDSVIVVDKPDDMVVHPGNGHDRGTMVSGLLARYPDLAAVGAPERPGVVHRLDRGTSGLLVVARTAEAYGSLVAQLAERTVERRYRALVWGHPESVRGLVDAPIGRSPKHPTKMAVVADGKEARTRYEVVQRFTEPVAVALLQCRLETGRTHQIRVHMAAIGHSVVGDDRYRGARESLPVARPFLHAEHLAFDHPVTGERMTFDAPLPEDLDEVLRGLR